MTKLYADLIAMDLPFETLRHTNILVTGGNGLIASSFIEALAEFNIENHMDIHLYALCRNQEKGERRFSRYLEQDFLHLLIQDVAEPLRTSIEFQYIIHAASPANPEAFNSVPVDVIKANFLGTLNLLEYSKKSHTRFIFVSSSEVYGENDGEIETFREDMPGSIDYTKFRACYPESKRVSETLCLSFRKQYGSDVVIVRPAYIYGPNILDSNNRADVYFMRQVLHHRDIIMYGPGTQIRSYCYINDCITGIMTAMLRGESGGIYNIGNPDCVVTLKEYAQALADHGNVKLIYDPTAAPADMAFLKSTTRCVLNTEKLENLGWKAKYSLDDGIEDSLKREKRTSTL